MPGEDLEFDIDSAVDEIGSGLGFDDDAGAAGGSGDVELDVTLPQPVPDIVDKVTPPADSKQTPEETTQTPASTGDPAVEPPKTWRKEAAAHWATLPPEARAEVLKREEDMFRGLEVYKADATFGKSFKTVLEPYLPTLQRYGIEPAAQVGNLMKAHHTLALGTPEQKAELFQTLARDYGVDLVALANNEPAYTDPAVQRLQTELQGVKSELSQRAQRDQQQALQEKTAAVTKFAEDKVAHPHFEEVGHEMAKLLESKVCSTLEDAYERAVWANPITRAKELTRQQAADAQKRQSEMEAKTAAARKATSANVRSSAKNGSPAGTVGSMDDTLSEALAAIKARG